MDRTEDRTEDMTRQDMGAARGHDRTRRGTGQEHDRTEDRTVNMGQDRTGTEQGSGKNMTGQDKGQDMEQGTVDMTMGTYTKQTIVHHYDSITKYDLFYRIVSQYHNGTII